MHKSSSSIGFQHQMQQSVSGPAHTGNYSMKLHPQDLSLCILLPDEEYKVCCWMVYLQGVEASHALTELRDTAGIPMRGRSVPFPAGPFWTLPLLLLKRKLRKTPNGRF